MAALPSTTNWDVQPGTGNDNNGGFFVPGASGTDFSKQASPQYALTGLASAGAGNTVLSAAAANDMVGNGAQVISGTNFNTGFFEVVSVVVGVSITFSTNNAGSAILTGVGASGVINIGGTLNTISKAVGGAIAGNSIYFKGTYTVTAALTMPSAIQNNQFVRPFTIAGYGTTHGDNVRATWTTATNSINLLDISSLDNAQFLNIAFTNTAATKGTGTTGNGITPLNVNAGNIIVLNCSFSGFNIGVNADFINVNAIVNFQMQNSEVTASVSHGLLLSGSAALLGNFIHANGGDGVRFTGQTNSLAYSYTKVMAYNVVYLNGGNGVTNLASQVGTSNSGNAMLALINNAFVSNTGDGVNSPLNNSGSTVAWNNIFWNNTGWGYNSATANALVNAVPFSNAFGSNTAGARQNFPVGVGDVGLSVDPFAVIGTDFSPNGTAGGGAACKGAAFGAFSFGTGHADIGPVQSSAGSTTTVYVVNQNVTRHVTEEA